MPTLSSTVKGEAFLATFCKKTGYSPRPEVLAREMSYVLMNKIIFYKILERSYDLPKLTAFYEEGKVKSAKEYLKTLEQYFERAKEDFELIFKTGLYDHTDTIEEEVGQSLELFLLMTTMIQLL